MNHYINKRTVSIFFGTLVVVIVGFGAFYYGDQKRQSAAGEDMTSEADKVAGDHNSQDTTKPIPLPRSADETGENDVAPNQDSTSGQTENANSQNEDANGANSELANTGPEDIGAIITTALVLIYLKYRKSRSLLT
jgi:hypothetical protein